LAPISLAMIAFSSFSLSYFLLDIANIL